MKRGDFIRRFIVPADELIDYIMDAIENDCNNCPIHSSCAEDTDHCHWHLMDYINEDIEEE